MIQSVQRGSEQRCELADVLRGFAIFGIIFTNFRGAVRTPVDAVTSAGVEILALFSFYPLFALLFGFGLAVQARNSMTRGQKAWGLLARRMLALFVIGSAHAILVWSGDILVDYAIIGLVAVALHRVPPKGLLAVAGLLFVVHLEEPRIRSALASASSIEHREARQLAAAMRAEDLRARESVLQHQNLGRRAFSTDLEARWNRYAGKLRSFTDPITLLARDVLMLFLLGMVLSHSRWLERARDHPRAAAMAVLLGAVTAVIGNAYQAAGWSGGPEARLLSQTFGNYGVTVVYVGTIVLLMRRVRLAEHLSQTFVPVGRTALSNYLLQSLAMTWLFLSYGVGIGRLGSTMAAALNIAFFFLVQVPLSQWWLTKYTHGPVEWVWRCLTRARVETFRRPVPTAPHLGGARLNEPLSTY
jgi:uncharacterized protein